MRMSGTELVAGKLLSSHAGTNFQALEEKAGRTAVASNGWKPLHGGLLFGGPFPDGGRGERPIGFCIRGEELLAVGGGDVAVGGEEEVYAVVPGLHGGFVLVAVSGEVVGDEGFAEGVGAPLDAQFFFHAVKDEAGVGRAGVGDRGRF